MQSQVIRQAQDHRFITLAIGGLIAAAALFVALALTVELLVFSGDQAASGSQTTVAYSHEGMGEGLVGSGGNLDNVINRPQVSAYLPAEAGEGFVDNVNAALIPVYVPNYFSPYQGEGLVDNVNAALQPVYVPDYFSPYQGEGLVDNVNAALQPVYVPDYFSPYQGEGLVDRINGELNGITSATPDDLPNYFSPNQGEGLLDQSNK